MKHDWKKIKTEYLKGISNKEICKKYLVKENTLNSKIQRENWKDLRTEIEQKTHSKTTEKLSDSLSELQAKFVKKQYEFFNEMFDDEINRYKALKSSPDYKVVMTDLKEVVRLSRQAINLFDTKTETNANVNIVNKYKDLSNEELESELNKRGLPVKVFDE
jgi:uncharacterized protein YjcR